ncbi:MAG: hypothetical protein N6V49_08495, partial [Serratia symbiotica]|nr:hypothetical protein [Serratia symbiotica]
FAPASCTSDKQFNGKCSFVSVSRLVFFTPYIHPNQLTHGKIVYSEKFLHRQTQHALPLNFCHCASMAAFHSRGHEVILSTEYIYYPLHDAHFEERAFTAHR